MKKLFYLALATLALVACNQNEPVFQDPKLPSETKWSDGPITTKEHSDGLFTRDEAVKLFDDQIPTKEQWQELLANSTRQFTDSGLLLTIDPNTPQIKVVRRNRQGLPEELMTILIPFLGSVSCDDPNLENKVIAYLWTANQDPTTLQNWYVAISEEGYSFGSVAEACAQMQVLLVESNDNILPEGALNGIFSVGKNKKVRFSQGNLQQTFNLPQYQITQHYQIRTWWHFAEHQWDYLGKEANSILLESATREYETNYDIDLFGWGTGDDPLRTTMDVAEYKDFVDWGTNAISNGGNTPGLWRTMSADEWQYLLHGRPNAEALCGLGKIDDLFGAFIFPDDWKMPAEVLTTFKPCAKAGMPWDEIDYEGVYRDPTIGSDHMNDNIFSFAEWRAMEKNGAVFLPAAGYRSGPSDVSQVGLEGCYWTSTPFTGANPNADEDKYFCSFNYFTFASKNHYHPALGHSVRLVMDVK